MDEHQRDVKPSRDEVAQRLTALAEEISGLVMTTNDLRSDQEVDRSNLEQLRLLVDGDPPQDASPAYADWRSWVEDWLLQRISRSPQRHRWCHRYDEHPEAADRLEALWVAWERIWPDVEGRLSWFRDHLDHHLAVLTAEDGPMRNCSAIERSHAST